MQLGAPMVPREHGAWAVLYGSFLAGLGVAGRADHVVGLLLLALTAITLANGALSVLVGRTLAAPRRRQALAWLAIWGAVAAASLLPVLARVPSRLLAGLGLFAGLLLATRLWALRARVDHSLPIELLGVAALATAGPLAHVVAVGRLEPTAILVWILLVLYFAGGTTYVRMRLALTRGRRLGRPAARAAVRSCLAYHLLLLVIAPALAAAGLVPWASLLAFAPALSRAGLGLRRPAASLDARRLGWSEVALAGVFVALLVGGFWAARLTT